MNIEFNAFAKPKALAVCIAFAAFTLPTLSLAQVRENSLDIQSATRSLNQWIDVAINQDSTRSRITSQSQAMRESGIASSTLMDPKLKVGFGGLPVDSFKFDEDPMTNLSVGLMQQFERGSTLELNRRKANQQANGVSLQTQVRERDITRQITQLWLEIGYLQRAHELMAQNHRLMAEMEQFVQTNYSIGKSEAQDLLNAQLQVSKIEDKLAANVKQQQRVVAQLSEWLGMDWLAQNQSESKLVEASNQLDWTRLDERLQRYQQSGEYYPLLNQHPLAKIADINIATTQTDVELAEQSYTPQFGVEVMYAYRQSDNMRGEPTSDLLNAYVTMDIPLFTGNRQDKALSAAQYQVGASQYQKDALLAQMNAEVNALNKDRINLTQRIERYEQRLLPYANARIEAVERGYQNNTAQFGDMISATTDAIALQTEHARLVTDLNITNSKLAALVGGDQYPSSQSNAANAARNQ